MSEPDTGILAQLDPKSPEGKVMYCLCDGYRVDQTFLNAGAISRTMRLHERLVDDALVVLAQHGYAKREDDLTRRGKYNWVPTFAGYQALYGEEQAGLLRAKVLHALERATEYLPDAEVNQLYRLGVTVNFEIVIDLLHQLERMGLTQSKPGLLFKESEFDRRWQLTGQGARLLENSRAGASIELDY